MFALSIVGNKVIINHLLIFFSAIFQGDRSCHNYAIGILIAVSLLG